MIRIEVRNPDSRQAWAQTKMPWRDREHMALMVALGLWDAVEIGHAFGTTRHSVYRAARHFTVRDA